MKKKMLIILTMLINFNQLYSQDIENRFKGGELTFRKFIASKIIYPSSSRENSIIGTSISSITIDEQGHIKKIKIINPLDDEIDKSVIETLKETQIGWLPSKNMGNESFIVQIKFNFLSFDFKQDKYTSDNLIKEVEVTAFGGASPKKDKSLLKSCEKSVEKEDYESAIKYQSELIKRNPFNFDYYKNRAIWYQKIGKLDKACEDLKKITDFLKLDAPEDLKLDCD